MNKSKGKSETSTRTERGANKPTPRGGKKRGSNGRKYDVVSSNTSSSDTCYRSNSDNDVAWYWKNPNLAASASNLYYNVRKGAMLLTDAHSTSAKATAVMGDGANVGSGIFVLEWFPNYTSLYGIGITGSESFTDKQASNDACNVASKNIYSFVRHANSGSANYEAPDLMMTILAADSIFAGIADAIRAYGLYRTYEQQNSMLPGPLLKALGWNYDDIMANGAQFAYQINRIIAKASVLWVPGNLDIVTRHYWMNTNVYSDASNVKGELYAFKMNRLWKFSPKTSDKGTSLESISYHYLTDELTISGWAALMDECLDALILDEDAGIMFGDLRKAYGPEGLHSLSEMDPNYSITPVYNEEVLMQIANSTAVPAISPASILQDAKGNMYAQIVATGISDAKLMPWTSYPINMRVMDPAPQLTMVATRLTTLVDYRDYGDDDNVKGLTTPIAMGSEIVQFYNVFYHAPSGWGRFPQIMSNAIPAANTAYAISVLSRFDWAPLFFSYNLTGSTMTINYCYGELNNVGYVSRESLESMHSVALLSEFNVPQM